MIHCYERGINKVNLKMQRACHHKGMRLGDNVVMDFLLMPLRELIIEKTNHHASRIL